MSQRCELHADQLVVEYQTQSYQSREKLEI